MERIDDSNYEQWLASYADGELDEASRREVERWLARHPEAAEELRLYTTAPRLEADMRTTYGGPVPGTARQPRHTALRWAAAAVVAALAVLPLTLITRRDTPRQLLADGVVTKPATPYTEPSEQATAIAKPATPPRRKARAPAPVQPAMPTVAETEADTAMASEPVTVESDAIEAVSDAIATTEDTVAHKELIYVDFLLVTEEPPQTDRQLLALKKATQEALQDSYLGRRLARMLPADEELTDMLRERRERTPAGVLVAVDALFALNKQQTQTISL